MFNKIFKKTGDQGNSKSQAALRLKLDSYIGADGNFDYAKYKAAQTAGNKRKIENVWVQQENIQFLSDYIKCKNIQPQFGLCHGTRRGLEQKWFSEFLNCQVLGTEISETARQFPNTIQWDFHEIKDEWINGVDFIYSNSLDHSFDPAMCLRNWMKCLNPNGVCLIEHSEYHGLKGVTDLDPFGAELVIMPYLILEWSKGNFAVREILDAPRKAENVGELKFLVLQNN